MKVTVRLWAHFRVATGLDSLHLDVPERATVDAVVHAVYSTYPALRDWDKSLLLAVGDEFARRDHVLVDGDEISIMPPVQGG
ncbi:MAG: MoaD/ThiS family protein [Verrucomicrobiota bacterium]|nr:MoaD/ThiS family protein [Verrucomicrobiota bacterium]